MRGWLCSLRLTARGIGKVEMADMARKDVASTEYLWWKRDQSEERDRKIGQRVSV